MAGTSTDVRAMLTRIIDNLKMQAITALFTSLSESEAAHADASVSSLMDTWVLLQMKLRESERRRTVSVIKSRGMAHSNREEEFVLTDDGVTAVRARHPGVAAGVSA